MVRKRKKIGSVKTELLTKSREAMLTAVQVFNNPNIQFKSETFVVLAIIAWTYLLHAYYKHKNIDYRYHEIHGRKKKFDKTKKGAYKFWELEKCLNVSISPIDSATKSNLIFLIGLRHEIEHQMTTKIDDYLSSKFQACCLNYNDYIKGLFGIRFGIDKHLAFSLQFSTIGEDHLSQLQEFTDLPKNISTFISDFDSEIPDNQRNSMKYECRVHYTKRLVNHKNQACQVIEFIPSNSPEAEGKSKEQVVIKHKEPPKYLPGQIVTLMQSQGYCKFNQHEHTRLWKSRDAKNKEKGFGIEVAGTWYWYDSWISEVKKYCQDNNEKYRDDG
jgi:hypothetical protein